jgi:plastocyanin
MEVRMRSSHRLRAGIAVGTLALALAGPACSKYGGGGGTKTSNPPGGGGGGGVTVNQTNFKFGPSDPSVASGGSIKIVNASNTTHTFTVTGQNIDVVLDGGKSQSVAISLPAGTYQFECRFHVGLGMKGTLTVT